MPVLLSRLSVLGGLSALLASTCLANNIQVSSPTLTGNTGTTVQVQFNLSWANSWRGGGVNNWDAAWVFVKYRTISGTWLPVYLSDAGHVAPTGSQIDLGIYDPLTPYNGSNPVVGAFIRRNANGSGTFSLTGVQLKWDYATLGGLSFNDITQVQVFAIEMVNVPQGAFYVGSGGTETSSLTDGGWASGPSIPFQFLSQGAVTFGPGSGNLNTVGGNGVPVIIASAYPKGYSGFYCMKYEISQQGYVDFLNTLAYPQQAARTQSTRPPNSAPGTRAMLSTGAVIVCRLGIEIQTSGDQAAGIPALYACELDGDGIYGDPEDGQHLASNGMNWGDVAAYLDWSGLRPMTELEFEKSCRGPIAPLANAYPWGTTTIATAAYTGNNLGANNEGITVNYSTTAGNANTYNTWGGQYFDSGPLRSGIFAAHASNTGRITAGAGHCGAMELGGNCWERVVSIGNPEGRAFNGTHGNGLLSLAGQADQSTWPDPLTATGVICRGGSFNSNESNLRVSERPVIGGASRSEDFGGRGVRTAP